MSTFQKYFLNFIIYYVFCILFMFGIIFQEEKELNEEYPIKTKVTMLIISPIAVPIYLGQTVCFMSHH